MYRLVANGKAIGNFDEVCFTKVNEKSGCFVRCERGEADGVVAGGKVYALTDSKDYQDFERVVVFEVDGSIEHAAELDFLRARFGLI